MTESLDLARLEAEELCLLEADDYHLAEKHLSHFIRCAWKILEPDTVYRENWHIGLISEHLEAVATGEIKRLIVNVPPRSMKSIMASVCFPAWVWTHNPSTRWLFASYAQDLSTRLSLDRRRIIESGWYRKGWGSRFRMTSDQNVKSNFENDKRGMMDSTSTTGSATGKGCNFLVIDDLQDPLQAMSDSARAAANDAYDKVLSSRLNQPDQDRVVIIQQRLHAEDLSGHVQGKNPGEWKVLEVPAEFEERRVYSFPSGKELAFEQGALMWPERLSQTVLKERRQTLGSLGYSGQYLQRPRAAEGGFFAPVWWKRHAKVPEGADYTVQFWDCAEVPGISNDYSICATWKRGESMLYVRDVWRDKVTFPGLKAAAIQQAETHRPNLIIIEAKSAGTQLFQELQARTTLPVMIYKPRSDKKSRAAGAQPMVESGRVSLPEDAPWVEEFIKEHQDFPVAAHDDQVDTTSMAAEHFREEFVDQLLSVI